MGHYQFEILISAGLLACIVIAALMCDLLKSKNEQLREMMVELKVRAEESSRREQFLMQQHTPAASGHSHRVAPSQQIPSTAVEARTEAPARRSASNLERSQAQTVGGLERKSTPAEAVQSASAEKIVRDAMNAEGEIRVRAKSERKAPRDRGRTLSPDALAAIERGVQMAANPKMVRAKTRSTADAPVASAVPAAKAIAIPALAIPAAPVPVSIPVASVPKSAASMIPAAKGPIRIAMPPANKPSDSPAAHVAPAAALNHSGAWPVLQATKLVENRFAQKRLQQEEIETVVLGSQTVAAPKKNWGALLNQSTGKAASAPTASATPAETPDSGLLAAIVAATSNADAAPSVLPAGYHDGFVLTQLVKTHQPLSGLVVSIGVTGEITPAVLDLMRSLLGASDFGCQSGADEFLLIYPSERGAAAQRRLSTIAQQLWNFQLNALGEYSIIFSWGGVEARSEAVEMVIASASDRMQETKRGRRIAAGNHRAENAA